MPRSSRGLRRASLSLGLTLLGALSGACFVDAAAPPPATLWRCESSLECPEGWSCDVRQSLCVPPGVPRIVGSMVLSHTHAGPAREVTLRFTVDRDLVDGAATTELVDELGAPIEGGAFELHEGSGARDLSFSLVADGVAEGAYEVLVTLRGAEGGVATAIAGTLVVDATPPGVVPESALVEPGLVDASHLVTVRLSVDEAIVNDGEEVALPTALAIPRLGGAPLAFSATRLSSTELRFTLDADGDGGARAAGSYDVFVDGLMDLAGNVNVADQPGRGIALGAFEVDDEAPVISLSQLRPAVLSPNGDDPVVRLCVSVQDAHLKGGPLTGSPAERPFGVQLGEVDITAGCVPNGAPQFDESCDEAEYSCSYVFDASDFASGTLPEQGPVLVTVSATDAAGNSASDGDALSYDVRPPSPFNLVVSIQPGPGNVLAEPSRLTVGSTLSLSFNTDESVRGSGTPEAQGPDPVVELDCGGEVRALTRRPPLASTFFRYSLDIAAGVPDGPCTAAVSMRDVAGNEATVALSPAEIVVDTAPPPAGTIDASELVHVRVPWGFASRPEPGEPYTAPFQLLHAAAFLDDPELALIPAELIDSGADDLRFVRVFDAQQGGSELGRILPVLSGEEAGDAGTPADGGAASQIIGWSTAALATRDAAVVYVSVVDSAGNESPRRRVDKGLWIASLGGKVAGSVVENPHGVWAMPHFTPSLSLSGLEATFADPVAAPQLADPTPGGASIGTERDPLQRLAGAGTFRRVANARAPVPPSLEGATLTYDVARARPTLFGGAENGALSPAYYELTSGGWDLRCDGVAFDLCFSQRPDARRRHAAAYDPGSGVTIVSGGLGRSSSGDVSTGGEDVYSDAWLFTGNAFLGKACEDGDAGCRALLGRHGHALLAEPQGRGLLLYGGCQDSACEAVTGDLVLLEQLDESATTLCDPQLGCTAPAPRYDAALTVDPVARKLLLFGGCLEGAVGACTSPSAEVYAFDLDTLAWEPLIAQGDVPAAAALARFATLRAPTSVIESAPRHVLAIAGDDDLYEVSLGSGAATFKRLTPLTWPADGAPSLASVETLAFTADPVERRLLLFASGQTWALTPRVGGSGQPSDMWVLLTDAAAPALSPEGDGSKARSGAKLALDFASGHVVLQGGSGPLGAALEDTWTWNGGRWSFVCEPCGPAGSAHALASSDAGFVLAQSGDVTLELDLDAAGWSGPATTGDIPPAARSGRAFAQVSASGHMLLFGGRDVLNLERREAFLLTPALEWIDLTAPLGEGPSARADTMMAWDATNERLVLFGGCDLSTGRDCVRQDTWAAVLDEAGPTLSWTELTPSTPPPARDQAAMAFDYTRGVVVMFGGASASGQLLDDVWELDGGQWRQRDIADIDLDGDPRRRSQLSMAQDPLVGGLLLFGGFGGTADTWRLDGGAARSPAHVVQYSLGAASLPPGTVVDAAVPRFVSGGEAEGGGGVAVLAWDQGRWRVVGGSSTALLSTPERMQGGLFGDDAARLPFGASQTLAFAVVPGKNGKKVSRVTSLYADVFVLYTLP